MSTIKIGFTGTQDGMTPEQKGAVYYLLYWLVMIRNDVGEVHLGDCIGADKDAYDIVVRLGFSTVGHPPTNPKKRAFCKYDEERPPLPYLDRNKEIVNGTTVLIATPKGFEEELRSGTWSTIRYGRKKNRPVWIILPDGSINK